MKVSQILSQIGVFLLVLCTLGTARADEQNISLAGKWRFSRDQEKVGLTQKWYASDLKTQGSGPAEIMLPGTTDEAKAGVPNPKKPSLDGLYRPNVYIGPAWYQREVEIPPAWKGKHVTLYLERNHWVTHAWLDDRDLGTPSADNLRG
jgi:beta-galactosidase/beta-glucuronidase